MKSKICALFLLLLMSLSFMSVKDSELDESERKFWGKETYSITVCSDDCCTTTTYQTQYVFWLAVDTEPINVEVNCW